MDKLQFVQLMDGKLKLIRTEYGLSQDKMSGILGISKKTIIEIEKSRKSLGWTNSVALASIFSDSTILRNAIGGDISGLIIAVAFKDMEIDYPKTWGGSILWSTKTEKNGYRIQQNMFSRHYRLLNPENRRMYVSFNFDEIEDILEKLIES